MAEIFQVILARNNEARLRFSDRAGALPVGLSVLRVTDGDRWWSFSCKSEGDNQFCISGSGWRGFASSRINCMVTLSKDDDDDFYRVRVRQLGR
ncbi:hypothetical protein PTKIN_Ptkin02bG0241500 [Pterospermum kingtungense]